jgi:hypothetical protein
MGKTVELAAGRLRDAGITAPAAGNTTPAARRLLP